MQKQITELSFIILQFRRISFDPQSSAYPAAIAISVPRSLKKVSRHENGAWRRAVAAAANEGIHRGTRAAYARYSSPLRDSSSRSSHRTIAWYSKPNTSRTTGAIQTRRALSAKPTQSAILPRYSGLRTSANGPVDTTGPRRSLRVREMTPMWCTAQSRTSSPSTTTEAPPANQGAGAEASPVRMRSRASASGRGSQVRRSNNQPPRRTMESGSDLFLLGLRRGCRSHSGARVYQFDTRRPLI